MKAMRVLCRARSTPGGGLLTPSPRRTACCPHAPHRTCLATLRDLARPCAVRRFRNEGLYLQEGKPYTGYLFVKSAGPAKVHVSLRRYTHNSTDTAILASDSLPFAGGNWTRLNFTLTPSTGTTCAGVVPGSAADLDLTCCKRDPGSSTCKATVTHGTADESGQCVAGGPAEEGVPAEWFVCRGGLVVVVASGTSSTTVQ